MGAVARERPKQICPSRRAKLKKVWPEIWALVAPRKGLILLGLLLMAINRVAGLALPLHCRRPLLDQVLSPHHPQPEQLLPRSSSLSSARWSCRPSLRFRSRNCSRRPASA